MELEKKWEIERKIVELAMPLLIDECKAHIQFCEKKAIEDMTDEGIARIVRYVCPIVMDFKGCVNAGDIAKITGEIKGVKEKTVLKPCPICGSDNMHVKEMGEGFARSWVVACDDCNMAFFYQKVGFIDKNDMIAFWNKKVKG